MSMLAPGAYVQESTSPSFTTPTSPTNTVSAFIGAHTRGPLTPALVTSWTQFVALYGGFNTAAAPSQLSLAVFAYFNNGGGQCYVIRVAHSDAASAYVTLVNSTNNVLKVTAVNPGVWGDNLYVIVTANGALFNLGVYYGGSSSINLVEPIWVGLSMTPGASNYAPTVLNNPNNGSSFITVTDDNVSPNVGLVPTAVTSQLGSGTGSSPGADGSTVTSGDLVLTTALLDTIDSPLLINLPSVTDVSGALDPFISYITTTRAWADSLLLIDTAPGLTPASVISYATSISPTSYAAVYYPWVTITDPASSVVGAIRTLPPSAFVMGQIAQTDASQGVQAAPAGLQTTLAALAPEQPLTNANIGLLTAANVNCIRFKQGAGTVIWGARTLSNNPATLYINVRRVLIYVEANLKALSDFAVFQDNNSTLWQQITMRFDSFLSRFWASGGFSGGTSAQSYVITCDETNNSPTSGTVLAAVGVAPSDPAEFIIISVGQWEGGTTVTEVAA